MAAVRHPLQGVSNIVRFNWHFYLLAVAGVAAGLWLGRWLGGGWWLLAVGIAGAVLATVLVSLLVSWYVYDRSDLYRLTWLPTLEPGARIVNIHAGFDETSALLTERYPRAELRVFDFYDPALHTEVSIKRARRAYPAHPATEAITTAAVPLTPGSVDAIFLFLAAHEIRRDEERADFFRQLRRALKPGGHVYVVEHVRDRANFLAYSAGAYHFLPTVAWWETFRTAGISVREAQKITPFITVFTLPAHAAAP